MVVRSQRVVLPGGERPASVVVREGVIAGIAGVADPVVADAEVVLDPGVALLPGLVDPHVHLNDPGTDWEGFDTGTRAAAAGGVTTLVDMPLDSVPTTIDAAALQAKRAAAQGRCHVDVGFWAGAVPGNLAELPALHEAGARGFKCFLADSGTPGFESLDDTGMHAAMSQIAELGSVLLVHATGEPEGQAAGREYAPFLATHPVAGEVDAVGRVIEAAARTGARAHVVHVSVSESASLIAAARALGTRITAETCPHYLFFGAETIPDGATEFACNPPIRDAANAARLRMQLASGDIDMVASDHSPCAPQFKPPDFAAAWGGISSLQLSLPAVWTAMRGQASLCDVARWMAARPAVLARLPGKGAIAVGRDADLIAFDPEGSFVVDPSALHHRHPITPYDGRKLEGVVRRTWLRGVEVDFAAPRGIAL